VDDICNAVQQPPLTGRRRKRERLTVSQTGFAVFLDWLAGEKVGVSAKRHGIHPNTVRYHRKVFANLLGDQFDIRQFQRKMFGLVPLILETLGKALKSGDRDLALALTRMLNLCPEEKGSASQPGAGAGLVVNNAIYAGATTQDDVVQQDRNLAAILATSRKGDRFGEG